MKVYYVESGLKTCYYLRCMLPLQENGWNGDITSFRSPPLLATDRTKGVKDADVIVFHRPDLKSKLELARLLKSQGKKIIFDNDDTADHDGGDRKSVV